MANDKCGTCRFFEVRNVEEGRLAQIARSEGECAPGEWVFQGERRVGCHGGGVKGVCQRWQERQAPSPEVMSTFRCPLYAPGGPVLRGAGSFNTAPTETSLSGATSTLLLTGAIAVVSYLRAYSPWRI